LTLDEVRSLIETPCYYSNIKNGFLFSCFTGLRFSDVEALTWGKLQKDSEGKYIHQLHTEENSEVGEFTGKQGSHEVSAGAWVGIRR
jgi:integrase